MQTHICHGVYVENQRMGDGTSAIRLPRGAAAGELRVLGSCPWHGQDVVASHSMPDNLSLIPVTQRGSRELTFYKVSFYFHRFTVAHARTHA